MNTQLTIEFNQQTIPAANKVADVVLRKSALSKEYVFPILHYLGFFEYDAAEYPTFSDYEDFENFTNTLHCQETLDSDREYIANEAAYELLSAIEEIPLSERKNFLENTEDWYHYYSMYCKNNNIEPIKYYNFEYGYEKRYLEGA